MSISSKRSQASGWRRAGFNLAETLFAMVIVSLAVTTSMAALAAGARNQSMARDRQVAAQIAQYACEEFFFQPLPAGVAPRADLECALLGGAGTSFAAVPSAIAARLTSDSGDLERIVGAGAPLFYLKPAAGFTIDRSQARLVFAVVTPAVRNGEFTAGIGPVAPTPVNTPGVPFESATSDGSCVDWTVATGDYLRTYKLRSDLNARTLVAWSADWYQYQDCEGGGDWNANGVTDRGALPSTSRVAARELARFNFYDPHFYISMVNP